MRRRYANWSLHAPCVHAEACDSWGLLGLCISVLRRSRRSHVLRHGPIEQNREATSYVDRILRGAKPADLTVQAPTKYETVFAGKAARELIASAKRRGNCSRIPHWSELSRLIAEEPIDDAPCRLLGRFLCARDANVRRGWRLIGAVDAGEILDPGQGLGIKPTVLRKWFDSRDRYQGRSAPMNH
jgi:hypothetical protein